MVCTECGAENVDSARFCIKCGAELGQQLRQQPVAPARSLPGARPKGLPAIVWVGLVVVVAFLCVVSSFVVLRFSEPARDVVLGESAIKEVTREVRKKVTRLVTVPPEVVIEVVTQVVKETVKETVIVVPPPEIIEKVVTRIVEVEVVVTRIVEKVVTATPTPTPRP